MTTRISQVFDYISDISHSGLTRVGACGIAALFINAPIFLAIGSAYAIHDRRKIIHELAILFFNTWYTLPSMQSYDKNTDGDWCFYTSREIIPFYIPHFAQGAHFLDPIAEYNGAIIFLGALPQKRHAEWLKEHSCSVIISLIEDHEYDVPSCIGNIMQEGDWNARSIEIYRFPSPDHQPIAQNIMERATEKGIEALQAGKSIYIHCRAGRGRSALITANILIQLAGKTMGSAIEIIQKARPQISINPEQQAFFEMLTAQSL